MPEGVTSSANMVNPDKWVDPLQGYVYDSMNPDALLRLATVKNGRIVLPGGASYGVLVIPGAHPMSPDSSLMSLAVVKKIKQLVDNGATVILNDHPDQAPGLSSDEEVRQIADKLLNPSKLTGEKGRIIIGPYRDKTFDKLGIARDVIVTDSAGNRAENIAWNHRAAAGFDSYFISNQNDRQRTITLSLRVAGRVPELWDPLTGEVKTAGEWKIQNGRTVLSSRLDANGSVFVVFRQSTTTTSNQKYRNWTTVEPVQKLKDTWKVQFHKNFGGPAKPVIFNKLEDWSINQNPEIKYYSGTASYTQEFNWNNSSSNLWLDLGKVDNIAEVYVNDIDCGTAWTYPYRVDISKALKSGRNKIRIEVSNTWANRLIGDNALPQEKQITWTNAPFRLDGKSLLPAGLLGPVRMVELKY